ncbi:hypothetical protein SDRG_04299 [Saprolegnia diclina VS20]|uniref:Cyclic nucleotide-binding domain-containing protein n=1 Tax=Saprolegnia diclina (strain VS20) TaxID=1156394 RepID=T0QVA4_SAPDV|nr:hypothetical protein SDRG_04299 [Saprolegnia diclina VS20]EQC38596.1 hypothetical protein SDRG_04299 [Saprolegnia diclina VS20]|eukprot:XP_008608188.1 hypothetical protein SDRG_04299 [Saprolegnia diclina VS20]
MQEPPKEDASAATEPVGPGPPPGDDDGDNNKDDEDESYDSYDSHDELSDRGSHKPPSGVDKIARGLMLSDDDDDDGQHVSAYMSRQAERAEVTGLSPMEEIKLAQGELAAKAAQSETHDDHPHALPHKRQLWRVVKTSVLLSSTQTQNHILPAAVTVDQEVKRIAKDLEHDVDKMTAAQARNFVESVAKSETIMKSRQDDKTAKRIPWYLINPSGRFRIQWDVLSVVLIIYNGFYIPLSLAFGRDSAYPIITQLDQAQWAFSLLYLADVIVNFFSAYETRGKIEMRWPVIIFNYLRTWFLVDSLAAFPFDIVLSPSEASTGMFQILRLLKLFRMLSFMRILHRLEYVLLIRSNVSSLLKFCLLVFLTSHWFSCFFYYISYDNPTGWVSNQKLQNDTLYAKYVNAFYWSIMTMTTVGYGDVCAGNTQERAFAIFAMVIGAWIFAYGITNVVATVANLNPSDTCFQRKMDVVNAYMDRRDLPMMLRSEIREFLLNARLSTDSKLKNESKILGELSALLRSKIALAINDSVLNKMPFFEGADHNFLMELALSMKMVCFPPHEDVIIEGEIGEEMFFIFRGAVEVLQSAQQICVLGEQQYFGEMAILNANCLRTATVRTLCFSELRMLTRQKFLLALTHFPAMRQRIAHIVHSRDQQSARKSISRVRPSVAPGSVLEKMAVSIARESGLFDPSGDGKIVGSTLQRISQMDIKTQEVQDGHSNLEAVIQRLVETQDMLVVELGRLEEKMEQRIAR